jgi:hypothetical protein
VLTDPQLNAWCDQKGDENSDKCAWTFSGTVSIGGRSWKVSLPARAGPGRGRAASPVRAINGRCGRGDGPSMQRAVLAALAAAVLGLVAATAADPASSPPSKEQIRFTAADQAAAKAAVVRVRDLGSSGWSGGAVKPDLTSGLNCPGYTPKQSDLVLTGAAESSWRRTGLELRSVAQVLKTRAMVARDWQRTVTDPRAVTCLRGAITKGLTSSERLVSFRRLAFPRVASYANAYRALIDVSAQGAHARVLADLVLVGRGRTELTLMIAAPAGAASTVAAADARLARVLLARVRA